MNDWITSTEAAAILGVCTTWLRLKAAEDSAFPKPYRPGARKLFWSRTAIVAFRDKSVASGAANTTKPKSRHAAKRRKAKPR